MNRHQEYYYNMTSKQFRYLTEKYKNHRTVFNLLYSFSYNKYGIETRKFIAYAYEQAFSYNKYGIETRKFIAYAYEQGFKLNLKILAICLEILIREGFYEKVYVIENTYKINGIKKYSLMKNSFTDVNVTKFKTRENAESYASAYQLGVEIPDRRVVIFFVRKD